MNTFHVLFLGAIEGFTEFLPISSTAHLVLASKALGLEETNFLKSFIIAIQFGAILSIVVLYWRTFLKNWEVNKRVLAAFIPTALVGFIFYQLIKDVLLESSSVILAALFLGGVFLILFEYLHKEGEMRQDSLSTIPYSKALLIGLAQALAVIPGVSRAAATIIGGMLLGIKRGTIVEFSFLLAVPTMAAAAGFDLLQNASGFSFEQTHLLLLGFAASFIFALFGVKFLLDYIKSNSFVNFGIYRIILAAVFFFFALSR